MDNVFKKSIDDMFKNFTILFLLCSSSKLLFAYLDEPYHDTAFMGPQNTLYSLTYFSYYRTDHFWNKEGKKLCSFNKFNRKSYRLDLEYDINCSNAVFLKSGYTMVDEQLNGRSRGLEDLEASWQHLLYENEISAFSGKLTVIIPIGPQKSCVRYGKWGGELKLLYSRIFELLKRCFWYDLGAGYRIYNGFPSDQIRADASIGCTILPFIWLIGTSRLYFSVFNGKTKTNLNNICFHPNFRLLSSQIQGIAEIYHHVFINAGGFLHVWGENVGSGGGFYSGLWLIF